MITYKDDYSYISATQRDLIDRGCGKVSVFSLNFEYVVNKDEKNTLNNTNDIPTCRHEALKRIVDALAEKYDIHQVSEETSTSQHYNSDWDLYFWSDRIWNGTEQIRCFSLTFNEKRMPERNMDLLEKVLADLNQMKCEGIWCRIQYNAVIDERAVSDAAKKVFDASDGKFVCYEDRVGKVKIVGEENGQPMYGFFQKGARKKYYPLSNAELLTSINCIGE